MVSRRLYRSGQSEYLINGRVGRLRDIQEMFMGVGLGPDSYAIIETGRIGLILSTKPMERRAIIEEAAGVTKFKTKKRLAEAKLESSKVNLSRVNDIVVEVEKQLGSLKRQAAKARRYSEIRDQMRGIVRQMLAGKARELDAEAARTSKQLEELTAAESQRATAIQQQEGEQDRLNQRIYELDAEIRQSQNVLNLTALEADRSENRIAFNRQRAEELAGRHAQVDAELAQATAQAVEWESRSALQIQAVTLLREESGGLTARVEAHAHRVLLACVRARHSTLTQILNDRSYTADAVQKLFAANARGGGEDFRAVGVLADYAEVEVQHEAAIEQYLRDELEYVVVETYDHARAGVSMLRNEVGGRATFFVDSLRNLRLTSEYEPIVNFRTEDGVISRLDKLVEFRDPLGAAAKQFLPRLRSAYLTDSAAAAEKLSRENSQYAFVTPDGTCYQGRMVTGGRPDEVGPLGMKRELRALDAEVMQFEHEMSEKQAALEAAAAELRFTEQALSEINEKQREAEREAISAMHRHGQVQSELARLGLELNICQNELARIRLDVENARQRAERAENQHAAAVLSRAEADAESVRLAEALVQLRGSIQSEQNELATGRAEFAAMNERLMAAEALAARLNEERAELGRRETALQQQVTSIGDETIVLARQSEELALQLEGLRGEKLRLENCQRELEQEWDAARTRVTQMEDHLRMGRQSLQELREQRSHAEVGRAKNDSDREHLRETCMNEVNAQPEDLIATEAA